MLRKNRTTICREGLYYLLILSFIVGAAMLREVNLLFILAGMMIGPLYFNWRFVTLSLRGMEVSRKLPQSVCASDLLVVDVEAANRRRRLGSWALVVEDQVQREGDPPAGGGTSVQVLVPYVAAGSKYETAYRGRLMQRGRYRFGPLRISTRFPLGLIRRTAVINHIDHLIVSPRLGRLSRQWSRLVRAQRMGGQGSQRRSGLVEADFHGLRDWRSGDSQRWIHWRTSARRQTLAVREFEQRRNQNLALLLDLWLPEEPTWVDYERVESAVSFAATVVADVCRHGSSRLLVAAAGQTILFQHGDASLAYLQEVIQHLAVIQAGTQDRLPELLSRTLEEISPGAATVLVSIRPCDLNDTDRFAHVWDDPRMRLVLRRLVMLQAGSEEFSQYFQEE